MASNILDPVYEQFKGLTLTYGFCSPSLARERKKLAKEQGIVPGIYPALDQHSAHELNQKGELICSRGGAACDFIVEGISSQTVAAWIVRNLPFDRIDMARVFRTLFYAASASCCSYLNCAR